MLVDAGENETGNEVVEYINSIGITDFDYAVGTHPHSDHIGAMRTMIKSFDIEEYLDYLKFYEKDGKQYTNDERAVKRKLSALRSMYNYFHKNKMISEPRQNCRWGLHRTHIYSLSTHRFCKAPSGFYR